MAMHGYLARVLPALLEARRVRTHAGLVWEEVSRLSEGIRRLSAGFTGTRQLPGQRYLADDALFDAYLMYYFPITYAKVAQVLAEVPVTAEAPRALDLGSGPGPGALALGHLLGEDSRIVAADRDVDALGALRTLWRRVGVGELQTFVWEAPQKLAGSLKDFDLIVCANLLNELFRGDPHREETLFRWVQSVGSRLARGGSLILIEPALRETSRPLLELRDALLAAGYSVRAPCFWRGGCPALVKERDWCHAAHPWQPPEWVRVLGDEAGIAANRINFSYLVLGREPVSEASKGFARVISDPLVEAGKRKIWVCGEDVGRRLVTRLDKLASVKNQDFDTAERGDVVRVEEARALPEEIRLDGDSGFQIVRRAAPSDLPMPNVEILVRRD